MTRAARLRAAFVGASVAWTCALALAPFAASRTHVSSAAAAAALAVYAIGHAVCHQLPARSFRLWTAQMPVCARCTGVYLGASACAVIAAARAPRIRGRAAARWWLAAAAAPTAATLAYEWTTGVTPSNGVRFAAGFPIGAAVAWMVVAASRDQVN